ncbi:MAG: hypothetical protein H0W62_02115 [Chitinophagales bacterium]|nr:hypothetical protein [Chitinophagales bacterium]
MFFSQIIGQKEIKKRLVQSVKENRVSHTQLFVSSEGSGDLPIALAFAQYLNCENKLNEDDSCGKCPSCIKAQKMIHPDIHYSYPVIKSKPDKVSLSTDFVKQWREAIMVNPYLNLLDWLDFLNAENKQGNITADECRDIIHKLSLKIFESQYKILIMWMAEYMGNSGNILLKLFEEPPEKTLIILITKSRDQLLSTIVSRCQSLNIPCIVDAELANVLTERHTLSREEARKIVRKSEGNYNEALKLISNIEDDNQQLFRKWMLLLHQNNTEDILNWVDEMSRRGRENQKSFFRYGLEFFRECLVLQHTGEKNSQLYEEEKRLAFWLTERVELDKWELIIGLFERSHYHIERNAHPKILFMNLSIQLQNLISNKKLFLSA